MVGKIRIGIIGAAKIVPSALLLPAGLRDDVVVTHVAARDPKRAAEFAETHGLESTDGYKELIEREDIDLVYIAIPPSGHCEWTIRALEAGKAVLCEKPFAMNAAEAEQMVAAAKRTGGMLIEAFHYRYHPTIRRAEELLRANALGRLTGASARFSTVIPQEPGEFRWDPALGGGALTDLGCYPVHALRTLIGSEPEVIAASADFDGGIDIATVATLRFPGGIDTSIRCGMRNEKREWDIEIIGEHGRLTIANFIVPHRGGTLTVERSDGGFSEEPDSVTTYSAQLAHVVDVLQHGSKPLTGDADAIANMRALDAIRAIAKDGHR